MTRVLVVDDEELVAYPMERYLTARGHEVDCADSLEAAMALLTRRDYAVAIVDLRLTGIHGVEGLDLISHISRSHPSTRVLLLSAYCSDELTREALRRGADRALRKPQRLADLAAEVGRLAGPEAGGS